MRRKIYVPHPAAGQPDKRLPVAGKRELKDDADHTVVVILELAMQALATLQHQRLDRFHDRRTLIANVSRRGMLHAGLRDGASADDFAQARQLDLFAHIELN
jgi:hypothetical protein